MSSQYLFNVPATFTGRSQFVALNGVCSSFLGMNCGVPQGSIAGPVLFILYLNDLVRYSNLLSITMYADDMTSSFEGKSLSLAM